MAFIRQNRLMYQEFAGKDALDSQEFSRWETDLISFCEMKFCQFFRVRESQARAETYGIYYCFNNRSKLAHLRVRLRSTVISVRLGQIFYFLIAMTPFAHHSSIWSFTKDGVQPPSL